MVNGVIAKRNNNTTVVCREIADLINKIHNIRDHPHQTKVNIAKCLRQVQQGNGRTEIRKDRYRGQQDIYNRLKRTGDFLYLLEDFAKYPVDKGSHINPDIAEFHQL